MKYSTALAYLRRLAKICGFEGIYTLHSPRAVLPTWAAKLGWHKEDRTTLGRWAPNSEMSNWYDRAVCNTELRLRNTILSKYNEGRKPSGAFELPKNNNTNEKQKEDDLTSVDSTSVVTSSEEEVNIADLDGCGGGLSGYVPSV